MAETTVEQSVWRYVNAGRESRVLFVNLFGHLLDSPVAKKCPQNFSIGKFFRFCPGAREDCCTGQQIIRKGGQESQNLSS